jgi:predicted nucleic acid-binding protein
LKQAVLDASIALCWALADEDSDIAAKALAFAQTGQVLVPTIWWFEVRNALIMNERRGRMTDADTTQFLRLLERLPIAVDRLPDESVVLSLVRRHRLSVYDASYLELAVRSRAPLATLDAALAKAAEEEGVSVVA